MAGKLINSLRSQYILHPELVTKWNSVIDTLRQYSVTKVKEISPVDSEKYKFDLWGLFKNEIGVDEKFIYPHIRVNGYDSSNQYEGKKLKFKLLDPSTLERYHKLFNKKKQCFYTSENIQIFMKYEEGKPFLYFNF